MNYHLLSVVINISIPFDSPSNHNHYNYIVHLDNEQSILINSLKLPEIFITCIIIIIKGVNIIHTTFSRITVF